MKQFQNYNDVKTIEERPVLPAGAYLCIIKDAKVAAYPTKDSTGMFEKLEIAVDIAEGDFKDYYASDFAAQTAEDKKWKGVIRNIYCPKDDGTEQDEWTKRKLKTLLVAIEESNPGFHWDWDEKKLKGLKCGVLFQNQEYDFNGRHGWKAQPVRIISLEDLKEGNFKLPDDLPIKKTAATVVPSATEFIPVTDDGLPF